ncbi:MAG TPA: M15 family metallopeptidase [Lachnospiraceae bacterium]|nr:M15 family metallopeptidase [Lachnospiraceae bacterium]HPF29874.1 M15 family metallopeptidase [Lachnospiraceae bacterium]
MRGRLHQKVVNRLLEIGKKHKILKYPMLACIFVVLAFYYCGLRIFQNQRKMVSMISAVLVLTICSSFSLPEQLTAEKQASVQLNQQEENVSYNVIYANESAKITGDVILEDADVIEEYDADEFENLRADELYSAEELLEGRTEEVEVIPQAQNVHEAVLSEFDADDWNLILINKQHPVPDNYVFNLGEITKGMECDERIIDILMAMLSAAKADGINLVVCSPYRDYNRQEVLFNRKINRYMSMGYSYSEAYQRTSQAVTVPGASEHQIGLALDIISDDYTLLNEGFADTEAGKWLQEHCCEYGFILRYPSGKEDITGIEYEPWHFRYVGVDAACYIMQENITLEEFIYRIQ